MNPGRLAAWLFYSAGHLMWLIFDQWLPWGMPWAVYCLYNRVMALSERVQGDGPGPWEMAVGSVEKD